MFRNNTACLDKKHIEYITTDLLNIPPQEVMPEEFEIVLEISNLSVAFSWKKCWEFYWQLVFNKEPNPNNKIIELSLSQMSDLMKNNTFCEERIKFLNACVENIRKGILVCPLLRFMTNLLKSRKSIFKKREQNQSYVDYLLQEKNIIYLVIKDLKVLKEKISQEINENENVKKTDPDLLFSGGESYFEHINTRIKFIDCLLQNRCSEKMIFPYEILDDLWNEMAKKALFQFEIHLMYEFIQNNSDSPLGLPLTKEDQIKFLENNLNNKDIQSQDELNSIRFQCFQSLFNSTLTTITSEQNLKKEFSNFSKFVGIDILWDFVVKSPECTTAREAMTCLSSFFRRTDRSVKAEFTNESKKYLKKVLKEMRSLSESEFEKQCSRFLELLSMIMNESEKGGIENFQAHSKLKKGKLIRFSVKNLIYHTPNVPKNVNFELPSDTTVFELRVLIGKKFRTVWNQFELTTLSMLTPGMMISDIENGRALSDILIDDDEEINFEKKTFDHSTRSKLLEGRNDLNPLFEKIVIEWFKENSTNNRMSPEQCSQFINSCTDDGCTPQDRRVKDVFDTYDSDMDGYLTLTDFIEFYIKACRLRPEIVWRNLYAHSYTNEFRKETEIKPEEVDIILLPRFMISNDPEYLEMLFSLLNLSDKTAKLAWEVVNRLSTNRQVFFDVIALKGVRDVPIPNQDWNIILPLDLRYKLQYNLQVIACLVEEEEISKVGKQIREEVFAQNSELLKYKETWRTDFVAYGGLEHLSKIFSLYSQEEDKTNKLESTKNRIISLSTKDIRSHKLLLSLISEILSSF